MLDFRWMMFSDARHLAERSAEIEIDATTIVRVIVDPEKKTVDRETARLLVGRVGRSISSPVV